MHAKWKSRVTLTSRIRILQSQATAMGRRSASRPSGYPERQGRWLFMQFNRLLRDAKNLEGELLAGEPEFRLEDWEAEPSNGQRTIVPEALEALYERCAHLRVTLLRGGSLRLVLLPRWLVVAAGIAVVSPFVVSLAGLPATIVSYVLWLVGSVAVSFLGNLLYGLFLARVGHKAEGGSAET